MLRGYAWCRRNQGFVHFRKLKNGLVGIPVGNLPAHADFIFGAAAINAELVVRQFIYDRYGGERLNKILFAYKGSGKSIAAGMPAAWREYLTLNGLEINHLFSAVRWQSLLLLRFVYGIFQLCQLCARLAAHKSRRQCILPYVFLEGLSAANLPSQKNSHSFDICTFYAQWSSRNPKVRHICHNVSHDIGRMVMGMQVSYSPPAYELPVGLSSAVRLAGWGFKATLLAAGQLLRGNWLSAVMLGEAAKAHAVQLCRPEVLAVEYLFHASRTIYRPLWTYEAERLGASLGLYFYSTTVQPKLKQGYESQLFEWGPNTWPRFIVWDKYQVAMIRRDLDSNAQIVEAGPIFFSDSDTRLPALPANAIAVFDNQPMRPSSHLGVSTLNDCMSEHPDYFFSFLNEVVAALTEAGAFIVLKGKRAIGSRADRRYRTILKNLVKSEHVYLVDPAVSAIRVAQSCLASISVPLTSTAVHAYSLNMPSVYYDPKGWMQSDDDGAHGVPILQGKVQLREWIEQVLCDAKTRSIQ
jgi:polysaccharide biosynthesis PFTS motif protein